MTNIEKNKNKMNEKKPSKLRQTIPQICAVGAENCLLFTLGSFFGFITIVLTDLTENKKDIPARESDRSWLGSVSSISAPIGCLLSGPLSIYLGSKKIMHLSMIPYTIMWLIFYYSKTLNSLCLAFSLGGFTRGLIGSSITIYVAEITQPRLRGILLSCLSVSLLIGILIQYLVGLFTDWRTVSLISLVYPLLGFIAFSFVPDSPYWLAGKGRVEDAERALCWLRGWVSPSLVQKELTAIRNTSESPASDPKEGENMKTKFWVKFTEREFVRPFSLTLLCFFIGCCGGSTAIQTHLGSVFEKINSPVNVKLATVFLGVAQLIGSVVTLFAVSSTGKRVINFASVGGIALCYFGVSVYGYLIKLNFIDGNSYSWIPMTLIIGGAFFNFLGIRNLPWFLLGEIFSSKVKAVATLTLIVLSYLLEAAANGTFHGISNMIGLSGTFLLYAGVNVVGLILLWVALPETEGRTLQDIKLHYNGTRSLKLKPRTGE